MQLALRRLKTEVERVSNAPSKPLKAYFYGMTLLSTIHKLKEGYPVEDTYAEIVKTNIVPGGEAANGATLLSHWGVETVLDGPHLGNATRGQLLEALQKYGVDCSSMHYDPDFEGWKDIVLSGGGTRTVFGWFQSLFSEGHRNWNEVNQEAVELADVVAIDPFFGESSLQVARVCIKNKTPFVSIDSHFDDVLAQKAAAIVVSGEFREREFAGVDRIKLLESYSARCEGLVIFTSGSGDIYFAEAGEVSAIPPYPVEVEDTLAAGDSFRAGVAYAIAKGLEAKQVVRYGAAVAALVCGRFPSIHPVPTLDEVEELVFGE